MYIAHYKYENGNATDVYIPVGPDNFFSGAGSYNAINQPELFVSGGGTFDVPFDGVKLTWTVKSFNGNGHKTSSASSASSKSAKCNKSESAEEQQVVTENMPEVLAYPNPVRDKLYINMDQGSIKSVSVYDIYGKNCFSANFSLSNPGLEVNMSGLSAGLYFVRIEVGDRVETIRVIKL
jgi:hypothetical protein